MADPQSGFLLGLLMNSSDEDFAGAGRSRTVDGVLFGVSQNLDKRTGSAFCRGVRGARSCCSHARHSPLENSVFCLVKNFDDD